MTGNNVPRHRYDETYEQLLNACEQRDHFMQQASAERKLRLQREARIDYLTSENDRLQLALAKTEAELLLLRVVRAHRRESQS